MRFGNCGNCGEYKFLDDGDMCRSCINQQEVSQDTQNQSKDWAVVCGGIHPPHILSENLAKSEAMNRASKKPYLEAVKLGNSYR